VAFLEGRLFLSQSGFFENISDCFDWMDKSRSSKKSHFCFDHVKCMVNCFSSHRFVQKFSECFKESRDKSQKVNAALRSKPNSVRGALFRATDQMCAGSSVQESTPAGVSVFQQESEQDQEWIFLIGTGPGAGVIFSTVVLRS